MRGPVILLFVCISVFGALMYKKKFPVQGHITIGLLQTASAVPLDQAREGFIGEIKREFGDKATVIIQNAQGSATQAQAIASSFAADPTIEGFYGIASLAMQSLKAMVKRPIVFSAVTDPVGLHLRDTGTEITGSSDMVDVSKQIELLLYLLPHVKKIALLYNPAEPNSSLLAKAMRAELTSRHIEFEEDTASNPGEVAAAALHAVHRSQAVLVPTDNTVASAFSLVAKIASKAHVPVIISWTGEKEGAFAQFGVDYKQSGIQAAQLLTQVLRDGKRPAELPIVSAESKIYISREVVTKLGLSLPKEEKKYAHVIEMVS